jgi:hypothetical protein
MMKKIKMKDKGIYRSIGKKLMKRRMNMKVIIKLNWMEIRNIHIFGFSGDFAKYVNSLVGKNVKIGVVISRCGTFVVTSGPELAN